MSKRKTYKDRDHTVSKKAKELRRAVLSSVYGKPTNVGDPNNTNQGNKKAK